MNGFFETIFLATVLSLVISSSWIMTYLTYFNSDSSDEVDGNVISLTPTSDHFGDREARLEEDTRAS